MVQCQHHIHPTGSATKHHTAVACASMAFVGKLVQQLISKTWHIACLNQHCRWVTAAPVLCPFPRCIPSPSTRIERPVVHAADAMLPSTPSQHARGASARHTAATAGIMRPREGGQQAERARSCLLRVHATCGAGCPSCHAPGWMCSGATVLQVDRLGNGSLV